MKMSFKKIQGLLAVAALVACQPALAAGLALDNAQSTINFMSVKNQHIVESHHFTRVQGQISESGEVSVVMDLTSVDTGIEIRDTRLNRELFKTEMFPSATIQASVDPSVFTTKNSTQTLTVEATLDLHGVSQPISLLLRVATLNDGTVVVHNTQPVIITAETHGLVAGIAKLAELAGGISIGNTVPVSFSLLFAP